MISLEANIIGYWIFGALFGIVLTLVLWITCLPMSTGSLLREMSFRPAYVRLWSCVKPSGRLSKKTKYFPMMLTRKRSFRASRPRPVASWPRSRPRWTNTTIPPGYIKVLVEITPLNILPGSLSKTILLRNGTSWLRPMTRPGAMAYQGQNSRISTNPRHNL